jgi:hypothetical protein
VKGGKVIAVDQAGQPALIANSVGLGKTLLCAYPIEQYLANLPSAFEKPEDTHLIYKSFREWAGVTPLFTTDQADVEAASLNAEHRGYIVLVNHSSQTHETSVSTTLPVHSITQVTPDGPKPVELQRSIWKITMHPYDTVVVEWKSR